MVLDLFCSVLFLNYPLFFHVQVTFLFSLFIINNENIYDWCWPLVLVFFVQPLLKINLIFQPSLFFTYLPALMATFWLFWLWWLAKQSWTMAASRLKYLEWKWIITCLKMIPNGWIDGWLDGWLVEKTYEDNHF